MILAHPTPQMTQAGAERVRLALSPTVCTGYQCTGREAKLTRRTVNAAVQVHLQCTYCGRSLAGALARKEHHNWQSYAAWDDGLVKAWNDDRRRRNEEVIAQYDAAIVERQAEYRRRIAEYHRWCRTSPQWHHASDRVLWRSRRVCEACLSADAVTVHHLTYASGKLPPAWYLRAVCRTCHDRMHNGDDEWCEQGMER